jgi:hypothetical protein
MVFSFSISDDMHSQLCLPFTHPLHSQVPIIPQRVCHHISRIIHPCSTNRISIIAQRFDLILCLKIPKMNDPV